MRITEKVLKFTFNEKKDIIRDLKIIAKAKNTTVADMLRASSRRLIKANQSLLNEYKEKL